MGDIIPYGRYHTISYHMGDIIPYGRYHTIWEISYHMGDVIMTDTFIFFALPCGRFVFVWHLTSKSHSQQTSTHSKLISTRHYKPFTISTQHHYLEPRQNQTKIRLQTLSSHIQNTNESTTYTIHIFTEVSHFRRFCLYKIFCFTRSQCPKTHLFEIASSPFISSCPYSWLSTWRHPYEEWQPSVTSWRSCVYLYNLIITQVMLGTEQERARWRVCVNYVNENMGMAVGRMYVAEYFDEDAKTSVSIYVIECWYIL